MPETKAPLPAVAVALVTGCPTPIARLTRANEVAICNGAWERLLGGGAGSLSERLTEKTFAALAARWDEASAATAPITVQVRRADAPVWIELTLWPADEGTLWASGRPTAGDDVATARALLEVFPALDAGLMTCDRDGRILLHEGRALSRIGREPGELVGQRLFDFYPKDAPLLAPIQRALAGEHISMEGIAGKTHMIAAYAPSRDAHGEIVGFHILVLNVDNLAMAQRGQFLSDALRSLPIAVWTVDREGICTTMDGGLLAALGTSEQQYVGTDLVAMHRANGREPLADALQRALSGESTALEFRLGERTLRTRYVPLRDGSAKLTGSCAVSEDVTAQRDLERELRAQLELVAAQQRAIAELGTPIIEVWQDILAVPVVSTLDPARAERLLTALLEAVSARQARFALLDLTGVETVDTHTAQHLVRVIEAVGLLGCEGLITGIRPSVAGTLVSLGVDLSRIRTLRSLKDALRFCTRRKGHSIEK